MHNTMKKTMLTVINTTQNEIFSIKPALMAGLKIALCFALGLISAYFLMLNGAGFFASLIPVIFAWGGIVHALSCYDDEINTDDDISVNERPSPFFLCEKAPS